MRVEYDFFPQKVTIKKIVLIFTEKYIETFKKYIFKKLRKLNNFHSSCDGHFQIFCIELNK